MKSRYWQRKNYAVFRLVPDQHLTRVVGQCAALAILGRGYEVPNEALDVLVSTVVEQAVGQECAADGLYVSLPQWALKASMGQDVTPAAPAMHNRREVSQSKYSMWKLQFVSFQLFLKFKPFRTTVVWFCNKAWGKKKKKESLTRLVKLIQKVHLYCLGKKTSTVSGSFKYSITLRLCHFSQTEGGGVAPPHCWHGTWPWGDPMPLLFDGSTQALSKHRPKGLFGKGGGGGVCSDFTALHCFSKKKTS